VGFRQACWKSPGLITVVEMTSELPDPLNAGEKLSSYIDLLLATYPSVRGCLAPSEQKESSSELNIRDPS
jgi:hypothetical protein